MSRRRVLILCTGNSCRSQMAEGLVNHDLAGEWEAWSAGTDPAGTIHPLAIAVMAEIGIDISTGKSQAADAFRDSPFEAIITVCDDAAENCPVWLGPGRVTHIAFPDPAAAGGSEEERLATFREVRDNIRKRVVGYLSELAE